MYWYNLKIEKPSQNNSALYDFEAENYGELTIVEGQKIELLSHNSITSGSGVEWTARLVSFLFDMSK